MRRRRRRRLGNCGVGGGEDVEVLGGAVVVEVYEGVCGWVIVGSGKVRLVKKMDRGVGAAGGALPITNVVLGAAMVNGPFAERDEAGSAGSVGR